jgi:hypothetical protein
MARTNSTDLPANDVLKQNVVKMMWEDKSLLIFIQRWAFSPNKIFRIKNEGKNGKLRKKTKILQEKSIFF